MDVENIWEKHEIRKIFGKKLFSKSIVVWAGIGLNGTTSIYFTDQNEIKKLVESFPSRLVEVLEAKGGNITKEYKDFVCQFDECNTDCYNITDFRQHITIHYPGSDIPKKCLWINCTSLAPILKMDAFYNHLVYHIKKNISICPFDNCRQMFSKKHSINPHLKSEEVYGEEEKNKINKKRFLSKPQQYLGYEYDKQKHDNADNSNREDFNEDTMFDFNTLVKEWYLKQNRNTTMQKEPLKIATQDLEFNQTNINNVMNQLNVMQDNLMAMKNENLSLSDKMTEIFSFTNQDGLNSYQTKINNYKQELNDIETIVCNMATNHYSEDILLKFKMARRPPSKKPKLRRYHEEFLMFGFTLDDDMSVNHFVLSVVQV
ncbi:hypothetical protein A3Q56_07332 [Intoshia linei]|uniref:C2H2-type domain-containing protein n=1 Tax=Intoshia linei TaxID=1819745 RepID=A0A177ASG5_9BILA|nr:hypothetical protein A3Q56_07332 [Intoshia linei]